MSIDYRHGLSILELIAFFPSLVMALLVAWRHGFARSSGWLLFIIFSLLRIIGNCCYLATLSSPDNVSLYTAWAVCSSVGMSPLTLGLAYNLSRVNDSMQRKTGHAYSPMIFRILALVTILAAILSIVGVTSSSDIAEGMHSTETKVGVIIYLVAWIGLSIVVFMMLARYSSIEHGEHRLVWAVMFCVPLLLIRLAYSMISILSHNSSFRMITGNVTIQLVMVIIEEIIIVYIMLITGLTLDVRDKAVYETTTVAEMGQPQYAAGNYISTSPPQQKPRRQRRIIGGPITMLVVYIVDKINSRRS
ncbi:hypothetical protein PISL3812_06471 [Talaromyces islandicus]|uniref:DUF7702 domain-containing protein n=1 Tax=Talaromyces islandicus TaxID=28573 RepID=A0A0U1M1G5_TALIS|nr:hypothetical protein PISL3812_06471 [Talaromyces islandicus]